MTGTPVQPVQTVSCPQCHTLNRVADAAAKNGYRLVGDVDFAGVQPIAGKITPNPGGVGPMTIAMLMRNTVQAAETQTGGG